MAEASTSRSADTPLAFRPRGGPRAVCARAMRRTAFSIFELVMVTAIIGIIAAVAAPRYANTLDRYRADAAARAVIAELTRARADARAQSQPHRLQFDTTTHRLALPDRIDPQTNAPRVIRLQQTPYHATLVAVDFDGQQTISFDGFGSPSESGTIVIKSGSTQRTITVAPVSGKATQQ